ncbi:MAG: phosphotransferase [Proteobacteria bacterium]|nr:phosphotransferase [Pseudomonadota bacterium]
MTTIESVVSKIPDWQGKDVQVHDLSGGITNHNYRVVVAGTSYVVRIPGTGSELLAINRKNEYHNTVAASQSGVGPQVIHYLNEDSVMVLEFIEGPTMSNATLQSEEAIRRVAESLRTLHSGPEFVNTFNMFRIMDGYIKTLKELDARVPDDYMEAGPPAAKRIEAAVSVHPEPLMPCHNDLLAENLIDDGSSLRIIDYELAGNDEPCFELGNLATEYEYDDEQFTLLCEAYFGRVDHLKIARMYLFSMMSDLGWTLWGAIQNKVSSLDFDFWDYACGRWERVRKKIHSPRFSQWLDAASRG